MKAFVEHLSGIVRAGPEADSYGKPFDCAIAFSSVDGKTAVIKALTSGGEITTAHARAGVRALKAKGSNNAELDSKSYSRGSRYLRDERQHQSDNRADQ